MAELSDNVGGARDEIREADRGQISQRLMARVKILDFILNLWRSNWKVLSKGVT